ncbi:phosphate acyltransferase, partial [Corynebacterium sanguinis]
MADQSLLITLANRNYDGIDVEGFASKRGLRVVRLDSYGTDLQEMYDAHLLAEEPALVVGTGDVSFDGELAAALGIPVVLVTAEDANVELAERRLEELGAIVAGVFSAEQLADAEIAAVEARQVMSPVVFESWLIERAKEKRAHIVLPEGEDDRILQAAAQLLEDEVVDLTILGDQADIDRRAADLGLDLSAAQILNHLESDLLEEFAADFAELRKKKGISLDDARETMKDISYFGTMMVHKGIADGMVSGAAHTTAHTIKP